MLQREARGYRRSHKASKHDYEYTAILCHDVISNEEALCSAGVGEHIRRSQKCRVSVGTTNGLLGERERTIAQLKSKTLFRKDCRLFMMLELTYRAIPLKGTLTVARGLFVDSRRETIFHS